MCRTFLTSVKAFFEQRRMRCCRRAVPSTVSIALGEDNASKRGLDNRIVTSKYTLWSFFPKALLEQFRRAANVYFLVISVLQLSTDLSPTNRFSTILPLALVLSVSLAKEAVEDIKRHVADSKMNATHVNVLRSQAPASPEWPRLKCCRSRSILPRLPSQDSRWVSIPSRFLGPGDVIRLRDHDSCPADIVLLSVTNSTGGVGSAAYVETASLDGESNLKTRFPLTGIDKVVADPSHFASLQGTLECEAPNARLYHFEGRMRLQGPSPTSPPEVISIENSNILLRGMVLRNTARAVGMVVYAGHDTKLMQNSRQAPSKRSHLDRRIDRVVWGLFVVLLVMCLITAGGHGAMTSYHSVGNTWYLPWYTDPNRSSIKEFFQMLGTALVLYNGIVPISLYVTLEIVKFAQARQVDNDPGMTYTGEDHARRPARARTSNLNESLGQIEYLFSDKTGTLTANQMLLKSICLRGTSFSVDMGPAPVQTGVSRKDILPATLTNQIRSLRDKALARALLDAGNPLHHQLWELLLCTAICHTVLPASMDVTDKHLGGDPEDLGPGSVFYQSASPDEVALVKAACTLGLKLTRRDAQTMTLSILGKEVTFNVLLVNEFSSIRRCMSVLIQRPDGVHVLYAKGADSTLLPRVSVVNPNVLESDAAAANPDANNSSSLLDEDDRFAGVLESVTDRSTDTGYDPRSTGPDGHLYRNSSFLVGLPVYSPQGLTARTHNDSMKVGMGRSIRDLDSSRVLPPTPGVALTPPLNTALIDGERLQFPASLFRPWKLVDPVAAANAAEKARREGAAAPPSVNGPSPGHASVASTIQPPELSLSSVGRTGPRLSLPGRTIHLSSPLPDRAEMTPGASAAASLPSAYSLVAQGSETGLTVSSPMIRPLAVPEDPLAQMQDNLDDFASVGLRTLVFARRVLDARTAARFIAIHREASLKVLSREDALQRVANDMEQRLELLGASGIEDKLQEQVPETIRKLADAGCNVWMLTGDKTETAISIGLSCKLLHEEMDTLVLRAGALDSNMAALSAAKAALEKAGKWHPGVTNNNLAVIVEGTALHELLPLTANKPVNRGWTPFSGSGSKGTVSQEQDTDAFEGTPNHGLQAIPSVAKMQATQAREYLDYSKRSLLEVLLQSKCVIACRVSPLQKAQLVRMVRSSPKAPICAAVGDGANDVSMIQEADIGIGVEGKEGTQAVNVSDFSIARFHFLQRLLFIHGRNNYNRITTVILYSVCKNIAPVTVLFIFSFFDMFSGTTLFESYLGAAYNVVFTSIPIILVGIWDKDLSDSMAVKYPEVYKAGQKNDRFSLRQILSWLAVGLLCAAAVVVFGGGALLFGPTDSDGLDAPLLGLGACMHFMIVASINMLLALEVYSWNWRIAATLLGSILSWIVFLVVYASLFNLWSESTLLDVSGLWHIVLTNLPFWFAVPLVLAIVSMPSVVFSWWRRIVSPSSLTMIQEWDRGLAAPLRLLQRQQFSDTQSTALRHSGEGGRSEAVLANRASTAGSEHALRDGSAFLPLYKLVGRRTAVRPTPRKSAGSGIISPVGGLTPKMDGADFDSQLHSLSKMINDAHTVISRRRKRFLKSLERRPSLSHKGMESPLPSPITTPVLRSELSMVPILTPGTPVVANSLQSPGRRARKSGKGSTWLRAFQTHEPDALIKKRHRGIGLFLGARVTNSTEDQEIHDPGVPGGGNVSVNRTAVTVSDGNESQSNALVRYNGCTQKFDDPTAENRFMNIFVRKATRGTRIALTMAWLFAIGYAAATYHDSSLVANGIRLALICVALLFILFTLTPTFRMYYSLSMCIALFFGGLAKTAAIDAGGEFGQTLFQLGVLLLVRLRPIHTLAICIIDLIIYVIFSVQRGHVDVLPQFLVYIAFVTSFAGAGAYFLHSAMRHDHLEQSRMFLAERKGAELLTNMLPSHVIAVLRQTQGKAVNTISFAEPAISVLFIDICGFYHLVAQHTPNSLVDLMDRFFSLLDTLAEKHGVMKYETVSKSYVAVCGLQGDTEEHTAVLALFGLDVLRHLSMLHTKDGQQALTVRMGLHTGPVVTGMVGAAERDGTLNATPQAHDALVGRFIMHAHTENVKSKGKMACYTISGVLTARRDSATTGLRQSMRPSMRSTFHSGDDTALPALPAVPAAHSSTPVQQALSPVPLSPNLPISSTGSNSGVQALRIRSNHHSHSRMRDENSVIDDLESRLRAEWMSKQLKRMKAEQQRRVQRVDRQSKEVAVHYFTCKFRRADLETRWQRMFNLRSITAARVSLALLAAFHVFRMIQALVTNDVFIGSEALRHNPRVVREVVVHIGTSLALMLFLFVSMVCCSPPAAAAAALDADPAPEGEALSSGGGGSGLGPDVHDSFSRCRSHLHEIMLFLGGLAMTMSGHDALATTLDIMFFFAVVSNSGAVPFTTALVINMGALIAFTVVALASDWNDVQPTTTMWFFLASTYVMVAVSSGSVEYFRRHRFGIAQLTADEVHRNTFMLYRMLPVPIAKLLLQNDDNKYVSQSISGVTLLFCDIQGFTKLSAAATPSQIIGMLNRLFTAFDALTEVHGVFKLMTIGDCFVVVAGVPYEDVPADVEMAQTRRRRVSLLTAARMVGKIQRTVSTSQWLYSAASRVFSRKSTKSRPRLDFRQRPGGLGNKNNKNYRTFPMEFLDQENENDYRQRMRDPTRFGSSPVLSPNGFSPNRQLAAMLRVDAPLPEPPATAREVEDVPVPVVVHAGSDPATPILGADEKQNEGKHAGTGLELTPMRSIHGLTEAASGMMKLATINEDTPSDNLETNTAGAQAAPNWKGMFTTMASVDGMDVTDAGAGAAQTTTTKVHVVSPEAKSPQGRKSFKSPSEREAHLGRNGKSLWALSRNIVRALVGTISVDHEETGSAQDLRNLAESSANDLKNVGVAAKTMGSSSHSNEAGGAEVFGPPTPTPQKEKDKDRPTLASPEEGAAVGRTTAPSPAPQSPATPSPYVPPTPFPELEWAALSEEGKSTLEPIQYNAVSMLRMAVDMVDCTRRVLNPITGEPIQMRFGLHTGNIVGGVIGTKTFRYDMFGSDVLAANEMEANGLGGGVVVSQATHDVLCTVQQTKYAIPGLSFLPHTPCAIKGVGVMNSYIVILEGVPLADKASENEHG